MVNERLAKQWELTERHLRDAAARLGGDSIPQLEEYLEHNELGLAFDCLIAEGELRGGDGGFWRMLKQTATLMGLQERRNELRRKVREAEGKEGGNVHTRT